LNTLLAVAILASGMFVLPPQVKPQDKAPEKISCPIHEPHKASQEDHPHQGVVERGDKVMGFSHEKTSHHFRLYADGGAIEAQSNDPHDAASRDEIRTHFGHIAKMFAAGDFSAPMLIHEQNPPGTEEMKRLRSAIQYSVENTERGGRIRITTNSTDALQALHKFLRFQIADHQTGDTPEITKVP